MNRFKLIVGIVMFVLVTGGCFAMIETLSSDELITGSEVIVVGKVIDTSKASPELQGDLPPEMEVLANTIEINEHLTNTASKKQIVITTIKGFEDDIVFEKDATYLLFLSKNGENFIVFNSPQGALKIEPDGSLSGMIKLGVSLESAKTKIANTLKK